MLPVTKRFSCKLGIALLALAFLTLGLLGCDVAPVSGNPGSTPSPSATNISTPGSSTSTPGSVNTSVGWDSFMLGAQTGDSQYIILNSNLNDKTEALTQYVLPKVQFGTIAPSGKDVLYWQVANGQTQFFTIFSGKSPHPFYTEPNNSPALSGSAIWMSDSRHVLVLNPLSGIWQVDVQSGQAEKVLSLPVSGLDGIGVLLAYHDGYVYFQGAGGGDCLGAICRLQLGVSHPTLTHYSARQTGRSDFLLSPDARTIYYCNTGPAGAGGLYAVNSDGTHSRILRQSATGADCGTGAPVGFAADNGLVVMAHVNGKFELIELGATPQQDHVLLADAAPGASSLCASSDEQPFSKDVCPQDVALAPYSHALVVQAVMPNGKLQLWGTDLTTGKQQVLHPTNSSQPVQLLGWDQMAVCAGGRC